MKAIELRGLNKQYAGFSLGPLDLSVPEGCVMGLVGENGAGKSTLIRCLLGLTEPTAGQVRIWGKAPGELSAEERERIGVVFDENSLPELFPLSQVETVLSHLYRQWDGARFAELLAQFGLPREKRVRELSKGMKMKLAIAAALSHRATLLVLDEPTSGLDPMMREEILDLLFAFISDGKGAVLFSSHITSDLDRVCDYVTFLHRGTMVFSEERDRLRARYAVAGIGREGLAKLDPACIAGRRDNAYGAELLVYRDRVPAWLETGPAQIEDLMRFLGKEE